MNETYVDVATGLVLTVFGAFFGTSLYFLITAVKERHQRGETISAMEQELEEEARLNITKLDRLSLAIPMMEDSKAVPVFLPYRMSLATLHQARSANQLRLLPRTSQRRWWAIAEICEGFNGFVANTELLSTICLLHPNGLPIVIYRCRQLAEQARDSKQSIERILSEIASSKGKGDRR